MTREAIIKQIVMRRRAKKHSSNLYKRLLENGEKCGIWQSSEGLIENNRIIKEQDDIKLQIMSDIFG